MNRIKVMVSSTTQDLQVHRTKVIEAIQRCEMEPRAMERDSADLATPVDYSLQMVEETDVYVGVIGHRYGFVPAGASISITEMEYRRARELYKPILLFVIHDDHPVKGTDFERDPEKVKQLNRFKDDITRDHVVAFFQSPDELSALVFAALEANKAKLLDQRPATRAQQTITPPGLSHDPLIPQPPEPYIAHPYILAQPLFGRAAEIDALNAWAVSADTAMIIEAIGGMGKSALTWHWTTELAADQTPDLQGIMWWSFYESDGIMPNFVRHALAYVTDQPLASFDDMDVGTAQQALLNELKHRRFLFVLDGIERIMVAYHRMDAAMVRDEQVESARPTTARADVQLRSFTDYRHGEFLRRLVQTPSTKILISTRLQPADLQNRHTHLLINGVRHIALTGIYPPEEAYNLLVHLGVHGSRHDILRFTGQFGNHGLLLGILAGLVLNFRDAPGDFDAWYRQDGQDFRLSDLDISQRRTQILDVAMRGLSPELLRLLGTIALFRYPVDYDALRAINPFLTTKPVPPPDPMKLEILQFRQSTVKLDYDLEYWQEQIDRWHAEQATYERYAQAEQQAVVPLNHGLSELENRGLLQWDRAANRYDLHPVVRGVAYEKLQSDERREGYLQIRDYFASLPSAKLADVTDISDLRHQLEIYFALIGAERYREALGLCNDLVHKLFFGLNDYHNALEVLAPMFPHGFSQPPLVDEGLLYSYLAGIFLYTRRSEEAIAAAVTYLTYCLNLGSSIIIGLANLAEILLMDHQLASAIDYLQLLIDHEPSWISHSAHLYLMIANVECGRWDEAERLYQGLKNEIPSEAETRNPHVEHCRMLVQRGHPDAVFACETVWERDTGLRAEARMRTMAQHQLQRWWGEADLQAGNVAGAIDHFQNALTLARQTGDGAAAVYMAALARVLLANNQPDAARALLVEIEAQDAPLDPHDLSGSLAEIYLELGDETLARQYALDAYKISWADGEPYTHWWTLRRAAATLAALGLSDEQAIRQQLGCAPFDRRTMQRLPIDDQIRLWFKLQRQHRDDEEQGE